MSDEYVGWVQDRTMGNFLRAIKPAWDSCRDWNKVAAKLRGYVTQNRRRAFIGIELRKYIVTLVAIAHAAVDGRFLSHWDAIQVEESQLRAIEIAASKQATATILVAKQSGGDRLGLSLFTFGECDGSTIRINEASERRPWVRSYVFAVGSTIQSLQGDHCATIAGKLGDMVVLAIGGTDTRRRVTPARIISGYVCDEYQVDGPKKTRRQRPPPPTALARVEWSPASFVAPPSEPVHGEPADPLAGCTRDSVLAKDLDKRTSSFRESVRLYVSKGELVLLAAGQVAAGKPAVFEVHDAYKNGLGIDVHDVAFYLTPEAVRVMKMRLVPEVQAEVNQRVAQGVPAATAVDYEAIAKIVASTVAATMAPFFDRLLPAASPKLPVKTHALLSSTGYTQRAVVDIMCSRLRGKGLSASGIVEPLIRLATSALGLIGDNRFGDWTTPADQAIAASQEHWQMYESGFDSLLGALIVYAEKRHELEAAGNRSYASPAEDHMRKWCTARRIGAGHHTAWTKPRDAA